MFGISTFRLIGSIGAGLALLATVWLVKDRFHQKGLADNAASCAKAAAAPGDDKPLDSCLPEVKAEVQAARQARVCEAALLPQLLPETRFAMSQACGAGVKRLVAAGDAAAADRDDLAGQLKTDQDKALLAIGRAETRAGHQQERDEHARAAIAAAPRDAGGSIHCDAECLRKLGQ